MNFFYKKIKINYIFFISILISILDLISKYLMKETFLKRGSNLIVVNDYFNLTWVDNYGMTFGLLYSSKIGTYILILVAAGIGFLINMIRRESNKIKQYAISFILGGAIGNFIDRLIYGFVFDFIHLHYRTYHWYVFNIADSFVCLGITILLFYDFRDFIRRSCKS